MMHFKKRHDFKHKKFKNPPIIEAIFELRWKIRENGDPLIKLIDKKFKFFPGRFFDRIKKNYPEVEVLPNSTMPDDLNEYLPRFRFRNQPNSYPLIQIGPGVITVNFDKNFTQELFFNTCMDVLNVFFEVLPDIKLNEVILHYIDGFKFDYEKDNAFNYLEESLSTYFRFNLDLFENTKINSLPIKFHLESNFLVEEPPGYFMCQFRSGRKRIDKEKIIVMDTIFRSFGNNLPKIEKLDDWLYNADNIIHNWFLKMIDKIKYKYE